MQYTENYSLKLPGYGDNADVGDLNDNTTAIDALIHANRQIEAPAFSTATAYTAGDMCVYENVLYKFTSDKAAGNWDSTKVTVTNLADEVTDAAQSGGTTVVANPSAPATEDLKKLQVENTVYGIPDPTVTKTATGNPIEITDGADAPLVKCTTEITGSQDLHGYDKPWVGGAGKNKLPFFTETKTQSGCTVIPNDDGTYHFYGTATSANIIAYELTSFTFSGSYVFTSSVPSSSTGSVTIYIEAKSNPGTIIVLNNGDTFNAETHNLLRIAFYFTNGTKRDFSNVELMLRRENETADFQPYSNICPITAYTEGEIEVRDGDGNTTTHTTTYPSAIYRGSEDCVKGEVTTEWAVIASYAGETLPGEWISDRDEYAPGTTPTTGAQVAYALATPTTSPVAVSNAPIKSLSGYTHIESSTGDMEVEYITEGYQPLVDLIQESQHVYATTEQVVGKWIDGSDVYERTVHLDSLSSSPLDWETLFQESVGVIVSVTGCFLRTTGELCDIGSTSFRVCYNPAIHRGYVCYYYTEGNISEFTITVRYTKTSSNNRSLSKGATDSMKADLSEEKNESEESVDKVDEPTETIEEKEENAGESNSENER